MRFFFLPPCRTRLPARDYSKGMNKENWKLPDKSYERLPFDC